MTQYFPNLCKKSAIWRYFFVFLFFAFHCKVWLRSEGQIFFWIELQYWSNSTSPNTLSFCTNTAAAALTRIIAKACSIKVSHGVLLGCCAVGLCSYINWYSYHRNYPWVATHAILQLSWRKFLLCMRIVSYSIKLCTNI